MKVLIVDDAPTVRSLVKATLEPLGFTVLEASNGKEGLEVAKSCLLYTSPSPRDLSTYRMPSSA